MQKDIYGGKHWYVDGKLHRVDGPAIEYANSDKEWYVDGKLHRVDGPAVEYANGDKHWYIDGKRHRVDGPAIEYANGDKSWYIDGKSLTEEEFSVHPQRVNYLFYIELERVLQDT